MAVLYQSGPTAIQSSDSLLKRQVLLADVWPQAAPHAVLLNGDHPVLAVGPTAIANGRPNQPVGVVIQHETVSGIVVMDFSPGLIVLADVANVLTYAAGIPDTFDTSLNFGRAVFVDDSDDMTAGTTLTLSPLNDAGLLNPLAGYIWRSQTELPDVGIGGDNVDPFPITVANSLVETNVAVMLVGFGNNSTT